MLNERVKTNNGCGWTTNVTNPITDRMLGFVSERKTPMLLDVGAAFGVATIPALRLGAVVIANDIDQGHLQHIKQVASNEGLCSKLRVLAGRFPDIERLDGLDAVHCSNVLHFLSGEELKVAARFARACLKPNGQLFIQVGTPYLGHLRTFLPIYQDRIARRIAWPGEIDSARKIVPECIRPETPDFLHVLDMETLTPILESSGFLIDYAAYYTRPGLPEICRNDGRENLGIVATAVPARQ